MRGRLTKPAFTTVTQPRTPAVLFDSTSAQVGEIVYDMLPHQKLIAAGAEKVEEVPAREASTSSRRPSVLTTRCMCRPRRQKDRGGSVEDHLPCQFSI